MHRSIAFVAFLLLAMPVFAQPAPQSESAPANEPGATDNRPIALDPFSILGRLDRFENIGGSAYVVDQEQLEEFDYDDILRVLRSVPGVYVQEEEGFGLRPNIGIRGSGLDRSARIAVLEDGILIAPAPYSAPSAYYFPTQRRMKGVEVLKGPAAIGVGPRTTGGAINLRSTAIPDATNIFLSPVAGSDQYREFYGYAGGSGDRTGWLIETVQQESDGFKKLAGGDTGYQIKDYLAKFRVTSDPSASFFQALEFKFGYTDQAADETYLGLTADDFASNPLQRYAASQKDHFEGRHRQYQLTWTVEPANADWSLVTTAYNNDFSRNWFKLGHVNGVGISDILADPDSFTQEMDWIRGGDSPADAFTLRNDKRKYFSRGIRSAATRTQWLGATRWQATLGASYHEDEEDRFQDQDGYRMTAGMLELTTDNPGGSQTNRVSSAKVFSVWLDNDIQTGNWIFQPGVRFESMELERLDYDTMDPGRQADPARRRENDIKVVIPGIGVTYLLNNEWRLLAGVYRGYNPPSPGSTANEEESTNFETGIRYRSGLTSVDVIYFYNDYENLVGTVTASTGGGGQIGDQFDGGEAVVSGFELSASYVFDGLFNRGWGVPVSVVWTVTNQFEFSNSFDSGFGPWGNVLAGDEMPYIPENQGQLSIGLVGKKFGLHMRAAYQDETRAVAGSGPILAGEGTDSKWVLDLSADYALTPTLDLFMRVENLLDETYIAALRPAGLRPGKDRSAFLGFRINL